MSGKEVFLFVTLILVLSAGVVFNSNATKAAEMALAQCEEINALDDLAIVTLTATVASREEGEMFQTERVYYLENKYEHVLEAYVSCMCVETKHELKHMQELFQTACRITEKDRFNSTHTPNYKEHLDDCEHSLAVYINASQPGEEELK